jgi:hypothetical protein
MQMGFRRCPRGERRVLVHLLDRSRRRSSTPAPTPIAPHIVASQEKEHVVDSSTVALGLFDWKDCVSGSIFDTEHSTRPTCSSLERLAAKRGSNTEIHFKAQARVRRETAPGLLCPLSRSCSSTISRASEVPHAGIRRAARNQSLCITYSNLRCLVLLESLCVEERVKGSGETCARLPRNCIPASHCFLMRDWVESVGLAGSATWGVGERKGAFLIDR